ncbi:small acid-soluble spore protein H [Priestia aryabhattai]|uniref:small acid-soluble spore protein H n=1 Tax=Priestia megaterium TaxID=1404 RepID=UPI0039B99A1C
MDARRAQEIADSVNMANVIYNGKSIYIEHVDQQNGIATIHTLDEPHNKHSVSILDLKEK